jgi:hypothetical protein
MTQLRSGAGIVNWLRDFCYAIFVEIWASEAYRLILVLTTLGAAALGIRSCEKAKLAKEIAPGVMAKLMNYVALAARSRDIRSDDVELFLHQTVRCLSESVNAPCSLECYLVAPDQSRLIGMDVCVNGHPCLAQREFSLKPNSPLSDQGLEGYAARTGKVLHVPNCRDFEGLEDVAFKIFRDEHDRHFGPFYDFICVPVRHANNPRTVVAVITFAATEAEVFGVNAVAVAEATANGLQMALSDEYDKRLNGEINVGGNGGRER